MKKIILFLFAASTIFLLYVWNVQGSYEAKKDDYVLMIKNMQVKIQEAKIEEIRQQERLTLNGMRQAFINYMNKYNVDLFERDKNGFIHYGNIKGDSIFFNPKTMYIRNDCGFFYNIHEKKNGNMLACHVRPYWNKSNIEFLLSIVSEPYKQSGSTGDVIIFDSYTGEMIVDNSKDCQATQETMGKDGRSYITLNYKHPGNKNPNACLSTVNDKFMWRKDSTPADKMVFFFNETDLNYINASDFKNYPLGKYNREFQEKIILPFETAGIGNTDMQITIVLGAQEQEIVSIYRPIMIEYEALVKNMNLDAEKLLWQSRIIVGICLFCIVLLALYSSLCRHHKEVIYDRRSNSGNVKDIRNG